MDRLLEKDRYLRIFSVIVAIVLWIVVMSDMSGTAPNIIRDVSVELDNIPQQTVVLQQEPLTISIKYSGSGRIDRSSVRAMVDLRNAQVGEGKYNIDVSLPSGFQLVETTPAQLSITLDSVATKQVPVAVNITGALGEDYATRPPVVQPTVVTIEGASTLVAKVARVVGDVDVTGATEGVSRSLPVRAVDAAGGEIRDLSIQPAMVSVNVPIAKLPPGKSVPVNAQLTGSPAPGFQTGVVRIEPATVKVRGDTAVIAAVDRVLTQSVDLAGARASFTRDVQLVVPTGAQLVEPTVVRVSVEILPLQTTRVFESVPLQVVDVGGGLRATAAPSVVRVTVSGPEASIGGLTVDKINAQVSAKDHGAGTYRFPVSVFLPPGYAVLEVLPVDVSVTVSQS